MTDPAPDTLPGRVPASGDVPTRSLDEALEQLVGDYRESRLEQIAYPDTLSARGWRMCLRYAICVVGGVRGMKLVKEMDEAYPLREECGEDHLTAGQPL